MFNEDSTEAVLMVDALNAFNSIKREAFLHNTKVLCPALATFINNCYSIPSDLFVQGGKRLKSLEGATQGDAAAMAIYALQITPLLAWFSNLSKEKTEKSPSRQVVFADDLNGVGVFENLKKWWDLLEQEGGKFGYHVKASKSHIIVKEKYQDKDKQIFQSSKITITTEGHRYLGSVIRSKIFKENYIKELVSKWCDELTKLSEIAKTQPQAAYAAFTSGYKNEFSYFMQTIHCISHFMSPVEKIIK